MVKKKIFGFITAVVCLVSCVFGLAGCRKMDTYFAVVPTDIYYDATLNYHLETSNGNYDKEWRVVRTKASNICGEEREVIYVEYSYVDNDNSSHNFDRTLLYYYNQNTQEGYVLRLNGDHWESYTGSFGDKWSDIYGSMSKSNSFVELLTGNINGRNFPQDLRKETKDYLEYDFGRDNEVFRIANNPYHVLLYYNFDYQQTHEHQEATFSVNNVTTSIPYSGTITNAMIGLE